LRFEKDFEPRNTRNTRKEMANTPPQPPIRERSTEQLLDELCVELRQVAVGDYNLPANEKEVAHIKQVCAIVFVCFAYFVVKNFKFYAGKTKI
jgi:hypothetical protein